MHEKKLKILLVLILFFRVGFSIFLVLNVIKKKKGKSKDNYNLQKKRKWLCCLSSKAKQWFRGFFLKKKGKKKR